MVNLQTVEKAAAFLGLSAQTVRHKLRSGILPGVKLISGQWRCDLDSYMVAVEKAQERREATLRRIRQKNVVKLTDPIDHASRLKRAMQRIKGE